MRDQHNPGLTIFAAPSAPTRICVFCGARKGIDPRFAAAADELGRGLAERGFDLVYGGGGVGLMGIVARAAVAAGGAVTGIVPGFLAESEAALGLDHELLVVGDMATRKRLMAERADAFVALPGGFGTLEEIAEQISWMMLARHAKPIILLDIEGFWRPLVALFEHMAQNGFADSSWPARVRRVASPVEAFERLGAVKAHRAEPWSALPSRSHGPMLVESAPLDSRYDVYECAVGLGARSQMFLAR
jgi:uncharacterized protein (TIGR00730 family)